MGRPYVDESTIMTVEEQRSFFREDEHVSFDDYIERAETFVNSRRWCDKIIDMKVGMFYPGILCVFLFEVVSRSLYVDELVWVVVGDLPPGSVSEPDMNCPNAACALDNYVYAMRQWVEAVEQGHSVKRLVPVNAPPTKKYADLLRYRLDFIEENILPIYKDYLI